MRFIIHLSVSSAVIKTEKIGINIYYLPDNSAESISPKLVFEI